MQKHVKSQGRLLQVGMKTFVLIKTYKKGDFH